MLVVWRAKARHSQTISTATLKSFKSRVSLLLQRARSQSELAIKSRSHSPASDHQATAPAVIVRHRIVKPRLDDELAALDDSRYQCRRRIPHRRPRAWRDAKAAGRSASAGAKGLASSRNLGLGQWISGALWMWAPRRGQHELMGLGLDERSKLLREGHELRVLKEPLPERPSIIVALKAP